MRGVPLLTYCGGALTAVLLRPQGHSLFVGRVAGSELPIACCTACGAWGAEKPVHLRHPCQLPRTPAGEAALRKILRGCHPKSTFAAANRHDGRSGVEGLVTLRVASRMAQQDEAGLGGCLASASDKGERRLSDDRLTWRSGMAEDGKLQHAGLPRAACMGEWGGPGPPLAPLQEGCGTGSSRDCGPRADGGAPLGTLQSEGTRPGPGGWTALVARIRAKEALAKAANEACKR